MTNLCTATILWLEKGIQNEESFQTIVDKIIEVAKEHIDEFKKVGGELEEELRYVQDDPSLRRIRISKIKNMPLNSPLIDLSAQRISTCVNPHRVKATNYSRGVLKDYNEILKLREDLLQKEKGLVDLQYNSILKNVDAGLGEPLEYKGRIFCAEYANGIDFNNPKDKLIKDIRKNEILRELLSFEEGSESNLHKIQIGNIIGIIHKSPQSDTIYGVANDDPWPILVWLFKRILRTT